VKSVDSNYIFLHGLHSSVVLEVGTTEAPLWRYWGPRLHEATRPPSSLRQTRPMPPASLEFDQPLTIAPTFGCGWFGQAALLAHRSGQQFAQQWGVCETVQPTPQRIIFTMRDQVAALRLIITLHLEKTSDVLTVQSCLHNDGGDVLDVQWLAAATLPLPARCDRVQSYTGEWANEFQMQVETLSRSTWRRENSRGRTAHDCFPGAIVLAEGVTSHQGAVFGAHLGWSGNHAQTIEWQHDGQYQWQLGEWLAPGEVRLQPGECLSSPTVYAAFSADGLNGIAQSFHAAARAVLAGHYGSEHKMPPRQVHLNTWEAIYFDHHEDDLMALATAAAALGVERFVLDDGWFHARNNDAAGLGDWWPDAHKYPQGLLPLAQHVEACGMNFGLWLEPEMVSVDSDLYRAHPDWVMQLAQRPLLTGRRQLVLDLARDEVADYLFTRLHILLTTLPISYLKWDMNRDLAMAGHHGTAACRQQVAALYRLLARVHDACPALEIESCASGGGRIDLGILQYTQRFWTSDNNDALARISIQRGALQWLPPELLGAHVGAAPSHITGRSQALAFRAAVALGGHFGVELDVRKLSVEDRLCLKQWIDLYRRLRHEMHQSRVWQGAAGDGVVWQAHGGEASLILLIYRLTPTTQRWAQPVILPMLDVTRAYRIERLDPVMPAIDQATPYFFDELSGQGATVSGDWLVHHGLPLPRMPAETAIVCRLTALPQS